MDRQGQSVATCMLTSELNQRSFRATHVYRKLVFFPLKLCIDVVKFALLSVSALKEIICPENLVKPLPKSTKSQLPVDVRRSKTSLH